MPDDIRTQLVVVKHESCRAMAKPADLLWSAKEVATTSMLEEPLEVNSVSSKKMTSTTQPTF